MICLCTFSTNRKAYYIDWLIDCLRFYVPLKNISFIWRRHHCRWRAAKFRPMLGAQGLWAGMDLYRATPAVTRDLGFSGLIRRTPLTTYEGMWVIYSNPDPHGDKWFWKKCLFVCFESHEQFFSYLATVTIAGDRAANLDLCLALMTFSSEGSFTCHTYCDTGPSF